MSRASLGDGSDGLRAPSPNQRGTVGYDRSRSLKHTQRAHIVLLSAERLSV